MANEINEEAIAVSQVDDSTITKIDDVDSDLRVGMTLKNRFVLEKIIGKGGMGTIFKARDLLKEEMEDRKPFVAIKVLHPKLQCNESLIKALQREARKSQELAHPNIVNVHDFDRDGKYVFMVMEFLQGKPLNVLIEQSGLETIPLQERWSMIEKIGRGIAYAHEKKVIHYDIKPGNVFICDDGSVKILDFGIAKARRSSSEQNMTVFDQFSPEALTPAYATCEMLRWEPPDIRDDVYAFGCVAYEILTGKHPFNMMPATMAAKAGLSPPPIKDLPKPQWQAIKSTLEFRREDRMPNMVSFRRACLDPKENRPWNKLIYLAAGVAFSVVVVVVVWLWPELRCRWQPITLDVSYQYRLGGKGESKPIRNNTKLHSGDHYIIQFIATEDIYVYIFQIDGSQQIYQLFPSGLGFYTEASPAGGNPINAGDLFDKPFVLDNQVGQERIYLLTYRQPNTALEKLYRTLNKAREQQDGSRFPELRRQLVEMLEKNGCDTAGVFLFQHI